MNNFNNNNNRTEYERDNNFYDEFSSMEVNTGDEVSEDELSDDVEVPTRRRKRR